MAQPFILTIGGAVAFDMIHKSRVALVIKVATIITMAEAFWLMVEKELCMIMLTLHDVHLYRNLIETKQYK